MKRLSRLIGRLRQEEDGQGLTEYGMIVTLIAVGVLALLRLLYSEVASVYGSVATALQQISRP